MVLQMDTFTVADAHNQVCEPQKIHSHDSVSDVVMDFDSKHDSGALSV